VLLRDPVLEIYVCLVSHFSHSGSDPAFHATSHRASVSIPRWEQVKIAPEGRIPTPCFVFSKGGTSLLFLLFPSTELV